jgi:predicted acetyltransferase
MALEKAKQLGSRVGRLTYRDNNASARIIEKNSGKFENEVIPKAEKPISRYWINN